MAVIVDFTLVARVGMIMGAVVASMVMPVSQRLSIMFVGVFVLVSMLVAVGVRVLVAVHVVSMPVLMGVGMAVIVGMQMLVLVVALHYVHPFLVGGVCRPSRAIIIRLRRPSHSVNAVAYLSHA